MTTNNQQPGKDIDVPTNNQQVDEVREKVERLIIENRNSLNDPTTNEPYDIKGITDDFIELLTLKDEQHARELELARIEAKIDFINSIITRLPSDEFGKQKYVLNLGAYELLDKLSELNTQKEKLLNEQ